jgi:hypothetical protein
MLTYQVRRMVGQRVRRILVPVILDEMIVPGINALGFTFGVPGGKTSRLTFVGYQATRA